MERFNYQKEKQMKIIESMMVTLMMQAAVAAGVALFLIVFIGIMSI